MADENLTFTMDFVNQHIELSNDIQDILEKSIKLIQSLQEQLLSEYRNQEERFNEYKMLLKPELLKVVTDKIFATGREENKKEIQEEVSFLNNKMQDLTDLIENHKEKFIEFFSSKTHD